MSKQKRRANIKGACSDCDHDDCPCSADHPTRNLSCTKPKGHDGDHVACGIIAHRIEKWTNYSNKEVN